MRLAAISLLVVCTGGELGSANHVKVFTVSARNSNPCKSAKRVLRARCYTGTDMCHLQEVKRYEAERTANKSTYWVIFELIWRDYYRYFTLRWGNAIFMEYGITNRKVGPDCLPRCSF